MPHQPMKPASAPAHRTTAPDLPDNGGRRQLLGKILLLGGLTGLLAACGKKAPPVPPS